MSKYVFSKMYTYTTISDIEFIPKFGIFLHLFMYIHLKYSYFRKKNFQILVIV